MTAASLGNGRGDHITMEGTLGTLEHVGFLEDVILEIRGTEGILRVDLSKEDFLRRASKTPGRRTQEKSPS